MGLQFSQVRVCVGVGNSDSRDSDFHKSEKISYLRKCYAQYSDIPMLEKMSDLGKSDLV